MLLPCLSRTRPTKRSLALALATALAAAPAFIPATWGQAMFRGDTAHSGLYATEGPAALKGVKWTFKTGGPVISSPVLAGGTLFIGSDDKNLYALDPVTGAEKWKFATGGLVRSTPAVAGGSVYFGSYDGEFYAVDAATGKLQWKFSTPGEQKFSAKGLHGSKPRQQIIPDAWDFFLSSPLVADGRVYFGSGDGNIYALDAARGQLDWKFTTQGVVHASPALADGVLFIGSWDTWFYALDAATGKLKWKFKTGEDPKIHNQEGLPSSPCVADGVVYFGCRDSHLYALEAKTGVEKWRHKITWIIASPSVRDGRVYACTSIPAYFFALDAQTGAEIYMTGVKIPAFSSPAVAGSRAYFGSFNGKLYAADLATGRIAWEFQTEAAKQNVRQALTPDGDFNPAVMFRSDSFESMFAAVDSLFSLGAIVSSPAVDHGTVYVGSADGNIYALE